MTKKRFLVFEQENDMFLSKIINADLGVFPDPDGTFTAFIGVEGEAPKYTKGFTSPEETMKYIEDVVFLRKGK